MGNEDRRADPAALTSSLMHARSPGLPDGMPSGSSNDPYTRARQLSKGCRM